MRVVFVCSGNSIFGINPFIKSQGDSLIANGIELEYFPIKGKGLLGYIKASLKLRRYIKQNPIDIIHAHYTLSGWSTILAFSKQPIVLSLMGSDTYGEHIGENKIKLMSYYKILLTYLIQPFVKSIICKSKHIESFVYLKRKSNVIPNGISLNKILISQQGYKKELGLIPDQKNVLFLGSKANIRKNFKLVKDAVSLINSKNVKILAPYPVSHDKVIKYLNSADVLVVPSFMEGSPNVVKEAMACNCPIVSTNVGDIEWLFGNEPGYFLTSFEPYDVAEKIKMALEFRKKTNGRKRILKLALDAETVAKKIINVYEEVLKMK